MMTSTYPQTDRSTLLRRALQINAFFSAACGFTFLLDSSQLSSMLGIPTALLLADGLILPLYAALLWYTATRPVINRGLAWAAVGLDILWVLASIALLTFGWLPLTTTGWWAVTVVTLVVAGCAEAQYFGLRRSRA